MFYNLKKFLPLNIWTLLIFLLCGLPGKAVPRINWLELISFDKFVHAAIFFIEQILLMRVLCDYSKNYALTATALCLAYGGGLELMQYFVFSERNGDWLDFIANTTGAFVGLLLFNKVNKKLNFLRA